MMKRWIALLLAAMMLFSLAACGSSESSEPKATETPDKTLTSGGVSITLPDGFYVLTDLETNANLVAGFAGDEGFLGIYVIRDTLSAIGKDDSYTAADYAGDLRAANARDNLSEIQTQDGMPYFTYTETKRVSDQDYTIKYLNVGYRSGESCYLVQFFCYEQEYDYFRDYFFKWAGTVKFAG